MKMQPIRLFVDLPVSSKVGNELIAFIPPGDTSINGQPNTVEYRQLAKRCKDVRGNRPDVGLLAIDVSGVKAGMGAHTVFRNIVAISAVLKANFLASLDSVHHNRFNWSDYFNPFVYSFINDGGQNEVIGQTPSFLGIDDASKYKPMTNPALLGPSGFKLDDLDQVLYSALMDRWTACYVKTAPDELSKENARLFRSLEMAFIASRMPFDSDSTVNDYGTRLSLWVSAIEIIVNGKGDEKKKILSILSGLVTHYAPADKLFAMRTSKDKAEEGNLLKHLYQRILQVRNDFLHGNDVSKISLSYWPDGVSPARLGFAASIIFRIVLLKKLGVTPFPSQQNHAMEDHVEWVQWQKWFKAVTPPAALVQEGAKMWEEQQKLLAAPVCI
jgi:hypothetical protein